MAIFRQFSPKISKILTHLIGVVHNSMVHDQLKQSNEATAPQIQAQIATESGPD